MMHTEPIGDRSELDLCLPRPSDVETIVSSLKSSLATTEEESSPSPSPSPLLTSSASSLGLPSPSSFEYYMPAEWEEHSACLILFPHNPNTFRVEKASKEIIDLALTMATIGEEPVCFLCKDAESAKYASKKLREEYLRRRTGITTLPHPPMKIWTAICPSNDTWARDTAPTFVFRRRTATESAQMTENTNDTHQNTNTNADTNNKLIGLDWEFNAYGGPEEGCYWPCTEDRKIARLVCSESSTVTNLVTEMKGENEIEIETSISQSFSIHSSVSVPIILEGGSIHTDGEGTLLTTCDCLLHPNRNPHLTQDEIESVLKLSLGISKVLWLPHGLDGDNDTNDHVDNFCCFVKPGHVVLAWTDIDDTDDDADKGGDDETPRISNYRRCRAAYQYLQSVKDAKGRTIEITKLYIPSQTLRYTEDEALSLGKQDEEDADATASIRYPGERMAASYINFYIANKAVLVPQFAPAGGFSSDDPGTLALAESDQRALETLRPLFPGREVVGIPSREILIGGGNIHCQTQQVPAIRPIGGNASESLYGSKR